MKHTNFVYLVFIVALGGGLLCLPAIQTTDAKLFILPNEYLGYYDSLGKYTVIGNIKNWNDFAVIPTITVSVIDNSKTITETMTYVPVPPNSEIPFKMKFLDIISDSPTLKDPILTFERASSSSASPIPIAVLYDDTLIKHDDDGHITGRIQNNGNETIYYPTIFAVVHGNDGVVLDVTQNIKFIEKIDPGEIVEFSMYPDPAITDEIVYYSCFAPTDTSIIPLTAEKNGGEYNFRYDSGSRYFKPTFDEEGTTLTLHGYNSFAISTYANFEFPVMSGDEEFSVIINNQPVNYTQSIDEFGYWHVVFPVEPISQDVVAISGFDKGIPPPDVVTIPEWIKLNASLWAAGKIPASEFLEGIDLLLEKSIISVESRKFISTSQWHVPSWVAISAQLWSDEKITNEEFLTMIEYLVQEGVIVI